MKNFLYLFVIAILCSCSENKLENTKAALLGCWQLISVDGDKVAVPINYINYEDSVATVYWGAHSEQGLLLSSNKVRYDLKLDKDDHVLITNYGEAKTVVCDAVLKENSLLECTVLDSKKKWVYKRISEKELIAVLASALRITKN